MGGRRYLSALVAAGVVAASMFGFVSRVGAFGGGTPEYLDLSYGSGGLASISSAPSTDERAADIAVDSTDRMVIAGSGGPLFGGVLIVTRVTKSGTLDTSFGVGGVRAVPSVVGPSDGLSVLVEADGSIVVGGMVNNGQFYLAKLTSSGAIDTTFGSNGTVLEPETSPMGRALGLAQGPGGSIVVGGLSPTNVGGYLARLTSAGAFDSTFDGDGRLPIPDTGVHGVSVQPDGKIVAVGGDFRVKRFNTDGSPDATFGTGGTANVPTQDFDVRTNVVARNADGSFLVGGSLYGRPGGYDFRVVRVTATGALDTSFGTAGYLYVDFSDLATSSGLGDAAHDIHLLADGRFFVTGSSTADIATARFFPDGRIDPSFGEGGRVDFGGSPGHDIGQHPTECCSALQSDGALVLDTTSDAETVYHQFNNHSILIRVPAESSTPGWYFEDVDGPDGPGGIAADVGAGASSTIFNGQPHVFSYDATDGDLRHEWYDRGWHAETLDGAAAGPFGRVSADVGNDTATIVYAGQLHVFYSDTTNGALRHAWWTGTHWSFETLDGTANAIAYGHIADDVGTSVALNIYGVQLHAYYYDRTHGDLRHAWWTGTHWASETLDGNAASPTGRISGDVGQDNAVVLYAGAPHVWYHDTTNGDLRHAWWTGIQWLYETLDGKANNLATGRLDAALGTANSVALYGGAPHVWYHSTTNGDLRHAWWTGTQWRYETLDGQGGTNGRTTADVGDATGVTLLNGFPHVWYHDTTAGDLRHGWWDGTRWNFEPLDGFSGPAGRVAGEVGADLTVTIYANQPHVWYHDSTAGDLRHGWYA